MNVRALIPLLTAFALTAPPSGAEEIFRIDDFEDGDRIAATGAAWTSITDALLGSESRTSVSIVGPKGERALRLEGVLAKNGFAGLWVAVDGKGRAVDVSAFTAIRLRVKGNGALLVGLRGGKGNGDNFMAAATGTGSWSTVEIPLTELKARPGPNGTAQAFEPAETRWLGIQTALGAEPSRSRSTTWRSSGRAGRERRTEAPRNRA